MWWLFDTGTWLPMSGSAVFATRTGIPLKILFFSEFYFTTNKIKFKLSHECAKIPDKVAKMGQHLMFSVLKSTPT